MAASSSSAPMPDLPENCITHILSLTTPTDVCRSSAVSSTFLSAASSDYVWERMLPPDVPHLLSRSVSPVTFTSRKELFLGLCSPPPLIIDAGRKSFSLDISSGKKCFMLSARELYICWGEDERYWRWINLPESRFPEVAELLTVCWLDIHGTLSTAELSPRTRYAAYFVLKHTEGSYGFDSLPVHLSLRMHNSPRSSGHQAFIHAPNAASGRRRSRQQSVLISREGDGEWMEVEVGEFFTDEEDGEVGVYFEGDWWALEGRDAAGGN